MIPPSSRWHFDNSTVPCPRRVSFNIFKLVDTKNLEVKEKKVVLTAREENSFNLYRMSHPTGFCYNLPLFRYFYFVRSRRVTLSFSCLIFQCT